MVKKTYVWLNTYSKKKYYSWNWKFSKDLQRVSASYQTCNSFIILLLTLCPLIL